MARLSSRQHTTIREQFHHYCVTSVYGISDSTRYQTKFMIYSFLLLITLQIALKFRVFLGYNNYIYKYFLNNVNSGEVVYSGMWCNFGRISLLNNATHPQ